MMFHYVQEVPLMVTMGEDGYLKIHDIQRQVVTVEHLFKRQALLQFTFNEKNKMLIVRCED